MADHAGSGGRPPHKVTGRASVGVKKSGDGNTRRRFYGSESLSCARGGADETRQIQAGRYPSARGWPAPGPRLL